MITPEKFDTYYHSLVSIQEPDLKSKALIGLYQSTAEDGKRAQLRDAHPKIFTPEFFNQLKITTEVKEDPSSLEVTIEHQGKSYSSSFSRESSIFEIVKTFNLFDLEVYNSYLSYNGKALEEELKAPPGNNTFNISYTFQKGPDSEHTLNYSDHNGRKTPVKLIVNNTTTVKDLIGQASKILDRTSNTLKMVQDDAGASIEDSYKPWLNGERSPPPALTLEDRRPKKPWNHDSDLFNCFGFWHDPEHKKTGCALCYDNPTHYVEEQNKSKKSVDLIVGTGSYHREWRTMHTAEGEILEGGLVSPLMADRNFLLKVGKKLPPNLGYYPQDLQPKEARRDAFTMDTSSNEAPDLLDDITNPEGIGFPKGEADRVYLERLPGQGVLDQKDTYINCFNTLKEGGELFVHLNHVREPEHLKYLLREVGFTTIEDKSKNPFNTSAGVVITALKPTQ